MRAAGTHRHEAKLSKYSHKVPGRDRAAAAGPGGLVHHPYAMDPEKQGSSEHNPAFDELGAVGLEPTAHGLKGRQPTTVSSRNDNALRDQAEARYTKRYTCSPDPEPDPDLASVVEAWPDLPEPIRRAILLITEAAENDGRAAGD